MAAKNQEQTIQVPAPQIETLKVRIKGTAPLVFHKWSEKAIKMMLDKQMKKATAGREAKDPEELYRNSFYVNSKGQIGFPARNIKQAIVQSARFLTNDVKMTVLRGAIFVWATPPQKETWGKKEELIPVLVENKPISLSDKTEMIDDVIDGVAGHDAKNEHIQMRRDMVRLALGTSDVCFRGQVDEWEMEFYIQFLANKLSIEQVMNLLQYAGFSQGLGEWRPERNGDMGTFVIENN